MLLHAACFVLLAGILPDGSPISRVNAAPATYDQQQNGDLNVDAKFENFLVVVATSGSGDLLGNLASQVFRLNRLNSQQARSKQQNGKNSSETVVYETEDADGGREPYHVEIVHIDKEGNLTAARGKHSDESYGAKNRENTELSASLKDSKSLDSLQSVSDSEVSIDDSKTTIKKIRSLWNTEEHQFVDSPIKGNKRSANVERNSQVENLHHSEDLSVKEEALRATRPGISLKKQLSKKEEKEEQDEEKDVPLISEKRNELGNTLVEQELVLLGGGIENCGPGRFRDKLGICQTDKNFN